MAELTPAPHLQTFTGQLESCNWKQLVGKPERVLMTGGAKPLLTPVEGDEEFLSRASISA